MRPLHKYLEDLFTRFSYLLICFTLNSIYVFYNIETFLFLECYTPFIGNIPFNQFLITEPLQIIHILYWTTLSYSTLFLYPLFLVHLITFLCNTLYWYQKNYLLNIFKAYLIIYFPLNFLVHTYLLKNFIIFLFNWNLSTKTNSILLEVNPVLINLLYLITQMRNSMVLYLSMYLFFFFLLKDSSKITNLYGNYVKNKQFILLFLILTGFFFTLGDYLSIIFVIVTNLIIVEGFHLWTCVKLNIRFKKLINAHFKTNFKNFKENKNN